MYKTKKEAMVIKKFKQKPAKNIEIEGDRKAVELEIDHLCVNLRECSMVEFRPRMDSGRVWLMKTEYVIYSVRLKLDIWCYQLITLCSVQALTCLGFSLEKQVSSPKEHKEKCNIDAFGLFMITKKGFPLQFIDPKHIFNRLGICRNRRDRRSCKNFFSAVQIFQENIAVS